MLRELILREERLAVAVAAGDERSVVHDAIPKEGGDVAITRLAGKLVLARGADDLRELRVRVEAVQRIVVPQERIEDRLVLELPRDPEVLRVAGRAVEVRERLVHAAELSAE